MHADFIHILNRYLKSRQLKTGGALDELKLLFAFFFLNNISVLQIMLSFVIKNLILSDVVFVVVVVVVVVVFVGIYSLPQMVNPFSNMPLFLRVCNTSL